MGYALDYFRRTNLGYITSSLLLRYLLGLVVNVLVVSPSNIMLLCSFQCFDLVSLVGVTRRLSPVTRDALPIFDTMSDAPTLSITMLGAGQEVGRSCCVLQYRGKTIVCDAGIHPAYSGMASLPFIDELDWSTVDALLVTQ